MSAAPEFRAAAARLAAHGVKIGDVADFNDAIGIRRPSAMGADALDALPGWFEPGHPTRAQFDAWLADSWAQLIRNVANALAEMPTDAEADAARAEKAERRRAALARRAEKKAARLAAKEAA